MESRVNIYIVKKFSGQHERLMFKFLNTKGHISMYYYCYNILYDVTLCSYLMFHKREIAAYKPLLVGSCSTAYITLSVMFPLDGASKRTSSAEPGPEGCGRPEL